MQESLLGCEVYGVGFWHILVLEIGLYRVCYPKINSVEKECAEMKTRLQSEELRWEIVKAMMDEFPDLKSKVKAYFEAQAD
jgi:hypothetical protein